MSFDKSKKWTGILRVFLIIIIALFALPLYIILYLNLSNYLYRAFPFEKYERVEKITDKTYSELEKIDNIYKRLPEGTEVVQVYTWFDGWRTESVRVYLSIPEEEREEFVRNLSGRKVREISEESVNSVNISIEDKNQISIAYSIHNGHHNFGETIQNPFYKRVYLIFSMIYVCVVFFAIVLLILPKSKGIKRRKVYGI